MVDLKFSGMSSQINKSTLKGRLLSSSAFCKANTCGFCEGLANTTNENAIIMPNDSKPISCQFEIPTYRPYVIFL